MPGQQQGKLHFRFLTGDANWKKYGGSFISRKLNNGDWDYWLVLDVINYEDACGSDAKAKYIVSVSAISPKAAGEKNFAEAWRSFGMSGTFEDWCKDLKSTNSDELAVEVLNSYGVKATLWESTGNNLKALLREAHEHAQIDGNFLFGFAMDQQANALGADGWDFIAGNSYGPLHPEESIRAHSGTED